MNSSFTVFAHRGASGYEPENTLLAFKKALELKVKWLELDVHRCAGELIVFHDFTLERTTDGKGKIIDSNLSYIRSLNAGKGENIPLLSEVFSLVGRQAGINIELKGNNTAQRTAELLAEYSGIIDLDNIIVSSFDFPQLEIFKSLMDEIKIGLLYGSLPADWKEAVSMSAYSVHLDDRIVDRNIINTAHNSGLKVFVYTVNSSLRASDLREFGADGIFSDFPDICAEY